MAVAVATMANYSEENIYGEIAKTTCTHQLLLRSFLRPLRITDT